MKAHCDVWPMIRLVIISFNTVLYGSNEKIPICQYPQQNILKFYFVVTEFYPS